MTPPGWTGSPAWRRRRPDIFTPADQAALAGDWAWLGRIAGLAMAGSPDGYLDDALAGVTSWGFTPEQASPPVLLVHGMQDRMVPSSHSQWLAARLPGRGTVAAPGRWACLGARHLGCGRAGLAGQQGRLTKRAAPRGWGGRLIRAANRSRRLTTPWTCRPVTTGRCRKPLRSIIWAASSTGVSGVAGCGSFVIQADTGMVVRSEPDAAAFSTSRSVRMPARKGPCITRADPTFSRTIAAAASATGLSGLVETIRAGRRSPTVSGLRMVSATFADFEQLRFVMRCGWAGELLGEQPPQ